MERHKKWTDLTGGVALLPQHATRPRTNSAFWRRKFAPNKARDRLDNRTLRKAGWRVVRIWEHEMKKTQVERVLRKLRAAG